MHRTARFLLFLVTAACVQGCASTGIADPASAATRFAGAWKVDWCGPGQRDADCAFFTAYLVQDGDRICGTHYGADARQNRMDEGAMPSILGTARADVASIEIRSARNDSLSRARLDAVPGGIRWTTLDSPQDGVNGEPAFVPDRDVLRRVDDAASRGILEQVRGACRRPGQP
ncbi:MAG TPA: hypothetical protein VFE72_11745 [Lysobacter sp.]|nr:hypothetical protein [Lysobacter sp.]